MKQQLLLFLLDHLSFHFLHRLYSAGGDTVWHLKRPLVVSRTDLARLSWPKRFDEVIVLVSRGVNLGVIGGSREKGGMGGIRRISFLKRQ